jgi:hypothetical protein
MSPAIYFASLGLIFGTILIVFAMRSVSAVVQARARLDQTETYRQLADKAAAAEATSATALTAIQEHLADVRTRLAAVEHILKAVG